MTDAALSTDRFGLTLFMALVLHALVILGVAFEVDKPPSSSSKKLEIALVIASDQARPDKADYLAQANKMGSGVGDKKALNQQKSSQIAVPKKATSAETKQAMEAGKVDEKMLLQQKAKKAIKVSNRSVTNQAKRLTAADFLRQSEEIARLEAELNVSIDSYSKRPRKGYINSISAHRYKAASYEAAWRRKIERVGNLNYPSDVRRKQLSGTLMLTVEINQDGSLEKVSIERSSGHQIIDDAAINIVKLAAPFAPFPVELRAELDILGITRTWQFSNGGSLKTR